MSAFAALLASLSLLGWLYLAFFHGRFWQPFVMPPSPTPERWPSVDIIVPARNEAGLLPRSLPSLLRQDYPGQWRVLLVDDHSDDGTGETAGRLARENKCAERLTVLTAPDLPDGWSGKVAAMQAGVAESTAELLLFTDADIEHAVGSLRNLSARLIEQKLDLVSLMVKLHCESVAEKLLIPAFVFFFGMLYPFRRANDPTSKVAAAAGGVMLLRRQALFNIGGLARIRGALIDDCALARAIKNEGGDLVTPGRIELSLTDDAISLRRYPRIMDVWRMVARTAYTQLQRSPGFLLATVLGMAVLFLVPPLLPVTGWPLATEAGLGAWFVMTALFLPMILFYRLPVLWALFLPAASALYVAATIDSARLYWQGKGGQWKGRAQA